MSITYKSDDTEMTDKSLWETPIPCTLELERLKLELEVARQRKVWYAAKAEHYQQPD